MDIALTESQEMLKGIARSFMAREAPKDVIVGLENEPSGLIPELWKKACGLGWLGMLIPAEYGGGEASLCDTAVLYEELGRGPLPGPFFSSGVLGALMLLEGATRAAPRALARVARGERILAVAVSVRARRGARTASRWSSERKRRFLAHGERSSSPPTRRLPRPESWRCARPMRRMT